MRFRHCLDAGLSGEVNSISPKDGRELTHTRRGSICFGPFGVIDDSTPSLDLGSLVELYQFLQAGDQ